MYSLAHPVQVGPLLPHCTVQSPDEELLEELEEELEDELLDDEGLPPEDDELDDELLEEELEEELDDEEPLDDELPPDELDVHKEGWIPETKPAVILQRSPVNLTVVSLQYSLVI